MLFILHFSCHIEEMGKRLIPSAAKNCMSSQRGEARCRITKVMMV